MAETRAGAPAALHTPYMAPAPPDLKAVNLIRLRSQNPFGNLHVLSPFWIGCGNVHNVNRHGLQFSQYKRPFCAGVEQTATTNPQELPDWIRTKRSQ